jgi:hypothetical protein
MRMQNFRAILASQFVRLTESIAVAMVTGQSDKMAAQDCSKNCIAFEYFNIFHRKQSLISDY